MKSLRAKPLAGTLLLALLILATGAPVRANDPAFPFARRQNVPPWPQNLTWLNSAGPVELHDLRGRFVLLDFWTYCCINCMHILPELHKLEQAWPKNLVVIGVHSAKFSTEQQTPDILAAVERYKIEHPVINDARHELWDAFGVQAWPTLVLIDPEGSVVWSTSGEVTFEQLDKVLHAAMPYYRQRHLLDETPLRFDMQRRAEPATPLRFPGKIAADEASGRLFIADSNHNRIVVARFDGTLLAVIGSGAAGQKDGDFATAEFKQPQGMALHGDDLYVADTENHEIRRIDLAARKVTTIVDHGYVVPAGRQARNLSASPRAKVTKGEGQRYRVPLSSPWDVLVHGDELFIAMAGCHQIWKMKLDGSAIGPYAGNGREDIVDGPLLPKREKGDSPLLPTQKGTVPFFPPASFAQPSGLASDGAWLYVADSEGSSIRAVPFDGRLNVMTIVGTARLPTARLFTFGDVDGPPAVARLQHPLGVACYDGNIYVADTYNGKIRVVDPHRGSVRTLAVREKRLEKGDSPHLSEAGHRAQLGRGPFRQMGTVPFFEPGGLAAAVGKLFVADTNNQRIRVIDLKTAEVSTLTITGLRPPEPPAATAKVPRGGEKLPLTVVRAEHGQLRLRVELELPDGYELNPLAPLEYTVDAAGPTAGPVAREALGKTVRIDKPRAQFEIVLPVKATAGRDTLHVAVDYYYCREGAEGICKVGSAAWTVPLEFSATAKQDVARLRYRAK